ncbi:MAG: hypothetical protein KME32_11285 [Mojavia pulchra JT2-VF2]|jgi:hypothetical protein|uniref:Secreted protein n=1 Tax=Mojavia pulchra JT2-VF2 TaxID=287848 RepID=A0A951PZD2_9NOST|nr:hypothetical protein [Mojavia pulchra JT2-VF2]
MNKKLILSLLSSSAIFTSLMSTLAMISPAQAAQRLIHTPDGRSCITHPHGSTSFVCIRGSQTDKVSRTPTSETISVQPADKNIAMLDFTEEESDDAIQLFGCDCPYCLNSLRQLRGTGNLVY